MIGDGFLLICSMSEERKFSGIPEILLWLVIPPAFYFEHFLMGLMLLISWVLHIRLRRDPRFPNFASLFQVLFTIFSYVGWLLATRVLADSVQRTPRSDDALAVIKRVWIVFDDMPYAVVAYMSFWIFMAAQVFFWVLGAREIRKRRLEAGAKKGTK
jgi:hypothetical protein